MKKHLSTKMMISVSLGYALWESWYCWNSWGEYVFLNLSWLLAISTCSIALLQSHVCSLCIGICIKWESKWDKVKFFGLSVMSGSRELLKWLELCELSWYKPQRMHFCSLCIGLRSCVFCALQFILFSLSFLSNNGCMMCSALSFIGELLLNKHLLPILVCYLLSQWANICFLFHLLIQLISLLKLPLISILVQVLQLQHT